MDFLSSIVGDDAVLYNEPMSAHTTFQIGGHCDAMVFTAA